MPELVGQIQDYPPDQQRISQLSASNHEILRRHLMRRRVTTLPPAPHWDGREALYVTGDGAWGLVYDESIAKWRYHGGTPLHLKEAAAVSSTATTPSSSGSQGSITLPLAGDYDFEWGARIQRAAGAVADDGILTLRVAGTNRNDVRHTGSVVFDQASVYGVQRITGLAASDSATLYFSTVGGNQSDFFDRWLRVTPIKVS